MAAKVTDHILEVLKGWPAPYSLDKTAPLDASVTPSDVKAGMCMSLNTSGKLEFGLGAPDARPGIFIRQNGEDNDVNPMDVSNDQVGTAGRTFTSNGPTLSGLVCLGPYELQTTEFVGGSYLPGDELTAVGTGTNKGKLTRGKYYYDDIVGVISAPCGNNASGTFMKNHHNNYVIQFWSMWLPSYISDTY